MARNVEIKARVENVAAVAATAAAISDQDPVDIYQDDTFFACPNGRLKLRVFAEMDGQLIFYQRPDQRGPKESSYFISPVTDPSSLREALSLAYGQAGRVRKRRTLFRVGRTRLHLDIVEDLGHFVEVEVVLRHGELTANGVAEARSLIDRLGIGASQLIDGAYVDLLASRRA